MRKSMAMGISLLIALSGISYSSVVEEMDFHWQEETKKVRTFTADDVFYVSFHDVLTLLKLEMSIKEGEIYLAPKNVIEETYVFDNGDVYVGAMYGGAFHGKGVLYTREGMKLQGFFTEGVLEGDGLITYPNGDVYKGTFKYGLPKGRGVKYFANGDKYEGEMEFGVIQGIGRMTYKNKDVYNGQFTNGIYDGYGVLYDYDDALKQGIWDMGTYRRYISSDEINRILNKK
tara:strand:- start:511 stop:1200 length:690 start_codon:yes stop_codon:yes gene_type:complete